ncbi:hypothetical protein FJY94_04920 [Candidatus Kaiserbacteria bacterium]|nr:hypothetical protein [Candidatus Kaiserbacteria bacterium]
MSDTLPVTQPTVADHYFYPLVGRLERQWDLYVEGTGYGTWPSELDPVWHSKPYYYAGDCVELPGEHGTWLPPSESAANACDSADTWLTCWLCLTEINGTSACARMASLRSH